VPRITDFCIYIYVFGCRSLLLLLLLLTAIELSLGGNSRRLGVPRAGVVGVGKRKIFAPAGNRI
jgi:hypothetical protein